MLDSMISACLQMAVKDGAKSIAFPTVGCGKLGYDPKHVVDSFIRSHAQSKSILLVKTQYLTFILDYCLRIQGSSFSE